ncbi:hypothetical protein Acr_21g0003550 [Actinidia rufa]|uniref:CRA domain-containing protein n=1 Tax=Actinidia rufa TaxID=165716 RepID=A0A7J0GG27_9ERIC|nr:hypothetical protein Acr_21g0003550 [Actinidia rufa]
MPLRDRIPELFAMATYQDVRGAQDWELKIFVEFFRLLQEVNPISQEVDQWRWKRQGNGSFTVSSFYHFLTVLGDPTFPWKEIWVSRVPSKWFMPGSIKELFACWNQAGMLEDAVAYGRAEFERFCVLEGYNNLVKDCAALLAYEQPQKSWVGYLLKESQGEIVADTVNAMILSTNPNVKDSQDCLHSYMERLQTTDHLLLGEKILEW